MLRVIVWIGVLAGLAARSATPLVAPVAAQQGIAPEPQVPVIVTTGGATVSRAPDVAYITVAVESRARNPRDAQRQNAETASAVQKQLTGMGVVKDALRTLGLWLEQEFDEVGGRRVARGFLARNTLEVRLDDVARAGEIADAAVQAGASSLSGIRFDLKDRSSTEREALRLAVADARGRAEAAAAGAGRSVDRILRIDDSRAEAIVPRPMSVLRGVVGSAAAAATDVEPGLIEIRAQVVLTVSMK